MIGFVGEHAETAASEVTTELRESDLEISAIQPSDAHRVEVVVALDESSLLSLAREAIETPILPVGNNGGLASAPRAELGAAISSITDGSSEVQDVPTLAVSTPENTYRALMDVMLVTTEPAKISEYRVSTVRDGEPSTVDRVRADGVVVAGPAGTPGYATSAGGPILESGVEGVSVVPIGPFRINQSHWVLSPPLSLQVMREEVPTSLVVDDCTVGGVSKGAAIELEWGPSIRLVRTPVSTSSLMEAERGSKRPDRRG
ncbi:MAG: NAD(+)/NADH kinase [Halanaeroarchaeum sp.]